MIFYVFFFFKQKTAYEMRISDWSSDVCSSDLTAFVMLLFAGVLALIMRAQLAVPDNDLVSASTFNQLFTLHGSMMMFLFAIPMFEAEIGRASCRERVCQYV